MNELMNGLMPIIEGDKITPQFYHIYNIVFKTVISNNILV